MQNADSHNVLIIDDMHPKLMDILSQDGIPYTYVPDISEELVKEKISEYTILVLRSKMKVETELLKEAKKLKLIVRAGAGMDNIDVKGFTNAGIECHSCNEGNRDAVGEQAIGMLLSISACINKGNTETSSLIWDREGNRGFEIKGKTIGIIGFGNTGESFAKKLTGFDCKVIAYDKYRSGFDSEYVKEVDLETIYEQSDVISFHIPLTTETKHWINSDFINKLKNKVVLLNLSRGKIMKLRDVMKAYESGQLKAVALDVLENEDLESWTEEEKEMFVKFKNGEHVIVTPHVGGWTFESYERISKIAAEKILKHIKKSFPFVKDEDNI